MSLDPAKFQIESHATPFDHHDAFGDVMSEQLQRAPWMAISVLAHVIAGFLLYFILDQPKEMTEKVATAVEQVEPEDEIEKEKEDEVEVEPEVVPDETIHETDITEDKPVNDVTEVIDDTDNNDTSFDAFSTNAAVGLGPGAGKPYGGTPGRGPKGGKGGSPHTTITAGLEWLVRHQDEDGRWDCDGFMKHDVKGAQCDGAGNAVHDVGVTGLALLAFLGDGSTMRSGPYKDQIKKAVRWLKSQQAENGLFGTAASHDFIYDHAIATYAICEAYGLSKSKILKKTAQNAINYLEAHRNPYAVWRYQPRDNDNDVSVTGWCIMAYKSAKDFGLLVDDSALKTSLNYLDEVTDSTTGHCGYTKRGESSSRHPGDHGTRFPVEKGEAMTAVGLFCRFFLGQVPEETPLMKSAAETILRKPPTNKRDGSIDHYYWYYGSYALYQMGGRYWDNWRKQLTPAVVKTQRSDGNFKGSWDNVGAWGEDGGRVYSTAILVLTLEAYYRYTRLVR